MYCSLTARSPSTSRGIPFVWKKRKGSNAKTVNGWFTLVTLQLSMAQEGEWITMDKKVRNKSALQTYFVGNVNKFLGIVLKHSRDTSGILTFLDIRKKILAIWWLLPRQNGIKEEEGQEALDGMDLTYRTLTSWATLYAHWWSWVCSKRGLVMCTMLSLEWHKHLGFPLKLFKCFSLR